MTLTELITACGGNENLLRALRVEEQVILELANPALRSSAAAKLPFNTQLSQLSWQPEHPLDTHEWQQLGQWIEANQRKQLLGVQELTTSIHRPSWHIAPPQGLLNDPNGFIYHQGEYHLFYQLYPFACDHKDKYWAHVTSTDLINWTTQRVALCPSDWFDSHGVFSGHAVSNGDELMLFYTGNVRIGEQRDRITTQCLATSHDGLRFTKHGPVIDTLPPSVTPHCRDPKIVRHNDHWLMLLGAQHQTADHQLQGRLAIYRSDDLYHWSYQGLYGDELGQFGYMWECPDLFELNGQLAGIICPQGIKSSSEHFKVPHHNGYIKASLDQDGHLTLGDFTTLDYGFDFYAPQTAETPDGRRLLIGWMGLPDETDQPSNQDGWLHQLTCLRELSWEGGKMFQRPARELQALRGEKQQYSFTEASVYQIIHLDTKSYELSTTIAWPETGQNTLRLMDNGEQYCDIILDSDTQRILLDRTHTLSTDGEQVREIIWHTGEDVELQVLADHSSLEIFINNGEYAMSARVFTPEDATRLQLISDRPQLWQDVTFWPLG
ncbi:glycoside hydrolase family 32 protein [Photobacterium alginatilyticum]|uniref:Sucrose-6-phosphate hydrolase n=1 Tax=Photobacterium alginatilyticum TaxID=1775171 RepID=A0ABW9YIW1_9GAMM|nr:glycoside hydrolase family 32 protein [Photobacterium alginatilyticum]NBI53350.1 glycoside hydrolase family 32 protein [Photobacterium alginatilyticum]